MESANFMANACFYVIPDFIPYISTDKPLPIKAMAG